MNYLRASILPARMKMCFSGSTLNIDFYVFIKKHFCLFGFLGLVFETRSSYIALDTLDLTM